MGIFAVWIRNRWVIAALIFITAAIAVTVALLLLSGSHHGSYSNAWYVWHG